MHIPQINGLLAAVHQEIQLSCVPYTGAQPCAPTSWILSMESYFLYSYGHPDQGEWISV